MPTEKFEIEKLPNGKCSILFYDNIERNEFKQRYEYDLYRYETIYRPNLHEIVEKDFDKWLESAKGKEKEIVHANVMSPVLEEYSNKDIEKNLSDINSLYEYVILLEERMMKLELELNELKNPKQIKLRHRKPEHFELSPYEKVKRVICNGKMSEDKILEMMKNFVDNRYMTEEEFSELIDLLFEKRGGE